MKKCIIFLLAFCIVSLFVSCSTYSPAETSIQETTATEKALVTDFNVVCDTEIIEYSYPFEVLIDYIRNENAEYLPCDGEKYSVFDYQEFLMNNKCFSFVIDSNYRDLSYLMGKKISAASIYGTYPSPEIRTIDSQGQKLLYFVYQLNINCKVFCFFEEQDDYKVMSGYPILMCKTLNMEDFSSVDIGTDMMSVAEIDPNVLLYKMKYDSLEETELQKYVSGPYKIITAHLLTDGFILIQYEINDAGQYIVSGIERSDDFTCHTYLEDTHYSIYQEDYPTYDFVR